MPYLVLLAALLFAAAPLATPGFGGYEPNQFPVPQVDPPVQPAGYAFAIWGLLYAWLILHAAYGVWARRDSADWAPMRAPLFFSLALGTGWLWVAQQSPVVATLMIWLMWLGAVLAWLRAPARDPWLAQVPLGLYTGWLTAAASVSVGLLIGGFGVGTGILAAVIALLLALMLSIGLMLSRPAAPALPLAVIWALVAICVSNIPGGPAVVLGLAAGGALILAVLALKQIADGPRMSP
ncbi:hypothetical protein ACM25N_14810 [Roseovarius sp. C7]|uniref:hypothetical protein n=1 Tax=Roseovarius sp. C7 TaxID=3398643 RepID=UPI0039F6F659